MGFRVPLFVVAVFSFLFVAFSDGAAPKGHCNISCMLFCKHGGIGSRYDCGSCDCSPRPKCELRCLKFCRNGYVLDKNGCQTCICKPPKKPICGKRASIKCPERCARMTNKHGCPFCYCKPTA